MSFEGSSWDPIAIRRSVNFGYNISRPFNTAGILHTAKIYLFHQAFTMHLIHQLFIKFYWDVVAPSVNLRGITKNNKWVALDEILKCQTNSAKPFLSSKCHDFQPGKGTFSGKASEWKPSFTCNKMFSSCMWQVETRALTKSLAVRGQTWARMLCRLWSWIIMPITAVSWLVINNELPLIVSWFKLLWFSHMKSIECMCSFPNWEHIRCGKEAALCWREWDHAIWLWWFVMSIVFFAL